MRITKEDIYKFQQIYQNQFGKQLSDAEAQEQAQHCFQFVLHELKPIQEVQNEE